ncbi:FecR/PupR family sigma factor regulator [Peristeroidobacter agariperforans]|uniref:FecR/PupR family sigma factor regulator n=1 Tax=Peristeroidobacter agariperforans TaxID=268404 RepID=UPI003899B65A
MSGDHHLRCTAETVTISAVKKPTHEDDELVRAEAAVWLARLRSDQASPQMQRSFTAWLADDPSHAAAFLRLMRTWTAAGSLRRR